MKKTSAAETTIPSSPDPFQATIDLAVTKTVERLLPHLVKVEWVTLSNIESLGYEKQLFRRVLDGAKRGEIEMFYQADGERCPAVRRRDLDAWLTRRPVGLRVAKVAATDDPESDYAALVEGKTGTAK